MLKIMLPAVIALGGLLLSVSTVASAKPEYTKSEKKACVSCHVKAGSKDLNDAGKEWAKKRGK